ncbi:MAG: ABC transporter ATP-binding protein [Gammaproteobacteria bacterium]|nr:ABC transporter ATP-binding protein [Gammaproteobacteria bacterium]
MTKQDVLLQAEKVHKTYDDAGNLVQVLSGIDLSLMHGERIAIVGPSGSGKSTLLHLFGGLDFPSAGRIKVAGKSWQDFSEKERCLWRNQNLGFVYQFHHLFPELSALENVMMPLLLGKMPQKQVLEHAKELLAHMGLAERFLHRPHQLSGGERQRVAIARAMVTSPNCILADEPTGNLDGQTAEMVLSLWTSLHQSLNTALIVVTHDLSLAKQMDKIYVLKDAILQVYQPG